MWTFWSFNILAFIAIIYFQKRNALLLSSAETKEKEKAISEANYFKHWQNWSFVTVSIILVLLNRFVETDIPVTYFFYLIIINLTYTVFRNRKIYRNISLPKEYIDKEFCWGVFAVLLLAVDIFVIF